MPQYSIYELIIHEIVMPYSIFTKLLKLNLWFRLGMPC
jgi:hypothetical protein